MGVLRRIAPGLAALALAAGCGGGDAPPPAPPRAATPPPATPDLPAWRPGDEYRAEAVMDAARRDAELAALEDDRSVYGAVRRAFLRRAIGRRAYDDHLAAYRGAREALGVLDGARLAEEQAVLASVEELAAQGKLVARRMPAVFLNLRRNTRTWTSAPFPATGERRTFDDHPAVFQYVPGHGMQLHQLGSWGVVNAKLRVCLRSPRACKRKRLERRLEALARLAAPRGDFLAWEYYYPFAQGAPPWMSGMAQATAVQALSRGAKALDEPRFARLAERALGAFGTPPPVGVAVPATGGRRYVMYSFAPTLQILNGELQAVNGLRDAAVLGKSRRAARLVRAGDRAARATLGAFDTGAWSLYSAAGAESTLAYHQLTRRFLDDLCARTGRAAYCAAEKRFARYENEPPAIGIEPLRGLWARRAAPLRFSLSKGSDVQVRVTGPRGVALARAGEYGRGGHELSWVPPARGRYRVRVEARGPEGLTGVERRSVEIVYPKPKPKPKPKPEKERDAKPRVETQRDGTVRSGDGTVRLPAGED